MGMIQQIWRCEQRELVTLHQFEISDEGANVPGLFRTLSYFQYREVVQCFNRTTSSIAACPMKKINVVRTESCGLRFIFQDTGCSKPMNA